MNARRFDELIQRWRTVASGLPDQPFCRQVLLQGLHFLFTSASPPPTPT